MRRLAYRVGHHQNEELRRHWIAELLHTTAEQLVFIDETLFNEFPQWYGCGLPGLPVQHKGC